MYKYCFFFIFFSLFFVRSVMAQVDLPTGSAEVNFPLYNYTNGGKLAASVSLNYIGGNGIKVTDLASSVGLGWALQAGGVITRSVMGEPDDQVGGYLGTDWIPTGRVFSSYSNTPMPLKGAWVPLSGGPLRFFSHDASVIDDREMDIFTFTYNGRQGSFVIGTDGSIKILDNTNLKIEKVDEDLSASGILTRWSKFIITDEYGVKYTFSEKAADRIILYEPAAQRKFVLDPPPANLQTYVCGQNYKVTNYSAVNNWYLSEISDPLTDKKIAYTYESYDLEYVAGIQGTYSVNPQEDGQDLIVAQKISPRYKGVMKRLLSIDMPDNNQIQFNYYSTGRADLPGDKALQQVVVKKDDVTLLGYSFEYQYFCLTNVRDFSYGFTAAEAENARLCLKSFRKLGSNGVADNPYLFTYNTGSSGVPARNTPSFDHFGYFNGTNTNDWSTDISFYNNIQRICIPSRRAVITAINTIGAGTLTGIKYPTGGSLTYEYENNAALNGASTVRTGGIRVKKTTQSDGVGASPDIVKEYKYVLEDGQTTSGWGYEEPRYLDTSYTQLIIPVKGTYLAANLAFSVALPAAQSLFAIYANTGLIGVAANAKEAGLAEAKVGNLTTGLITSVLIVAISYVVKDLFSADVKNIALSSQAYMSAHPANQNPLPNIYSRVEVYEGSSTDNIGKTVYEFTSDKDFAISFPRSMRGCLKQRCIPWLYGLMKRQQVFNKNNEPVKEVYNKYNTDIKIDQNYLFASASYSANKYLITTSAGFTSNSNAVSFAVDKYYPVSGRATLAYTIEKKFTGNDYQMKRIDYEYDATYNNIRKVSILNGFNEKEEKRIYYPYDYDATGVVKTMMDNHIYNTQIAAETWIFKSGFEEQLAGAEINEFQQLSSGDIKPVKVYLFAGNSPVAKSIIGEFNAASLVRNNTYFKEAVNYTYNTAGYLATTAALNKLTSYIYSDNNEQIIAKVSNAGVADIGYSSFEPGAKGTWTVTAKGSSPVSVANAESPSGGYCLSMPAVQSIQKSGLDAAKKYILTYWKKDGTITVTGGTKSDERTLLTRNGWSLISMYVSQATSISLTGGGLMDELRLYPVSSLMSSITYDTQLNITSATGENNVAVYYDYDELGRLKNTYDADRNISSSTSYKYVTQ